MRRLRWLIVAGLERLCALLDDLPAYCKFDNKRRWTGHGCWGCLLGLAKRSADLEERWHTGVWKKVEP